jgi:hypothetical protein
MPAVALTAYARFEDRLKALRAGFRMHVPKPIESASDTGHFEDRGVSSCRTVGGEAIFG